MSLARTDTAFPEAYPISEEQKAQLPESLRNCPQDLSVWRNRPVIELSLDAIAPMGAENLRVPKLQLPNLSIVNSLSQVFKTGGARLGEFYNNLHGTSDKQVRLIFLGGVSHRFFNKPGSTTENLCRSTDGEGRIGRPQVEDFARYGIPARKRVLTAPNGQEYEALIAECAECPLQLFQNGTEKPLCKNVERIYVLSASVFSETDILDNLDFSDSDRVIQLLSYTASMSFNPGPSRAAFDRIKQQSIFLGELSAKEWTVTTIEKPGPAGTYPIMQELSSVKLTPEQSFVARSIFYLIYRLYPHWGNALQEEESEVTIEGSTENVV